MRVLSLGIMDIRGDLEDMERTKRINQKTEKSKENRDIKGTRGNSKKVEGSKEKKEHRSRGFWENKREKRTNRKNKKFKENPEIRQEHEDLEVAPQTKKIEPRKIRSSARRRRLGIAGIGVTGRCALKFLGRFEVSYIPPDFASFPITPPREGS